MKVIFLDIDGVLNSNETPNPRSFPYVVDRKLLARLHRVLEATGAKVVLTSSWRVDPIGRYAARYWRIPYVGCCPDLPGVPRREEILRWLDRHSAVKRYVVVDDEDDELDGLPLFQPSAKSGLTAEIAHGIERYLNCKTDDTMRAGLVTRLVQRAESAFHRQKD